ncbi:Protein vip1 [Recurvomyces mirabilis]|uniref:Protein vip1 n=1 Tax=Recurvomyces mirabilis TaxID=574656 RepID=A0AAE0WJX0_9PEZI|nr:Protein vip1 [Recurvomyces mirabilis]KAK5150855.1 Protein vip1 [Recurvomyces mirabilis]
MSSTVHVKGISGSTSEKEVRDFFSFCGKIQSLSVTPENDSSSAPQSATVTFEKETAAKTALLLDNTQLGPNQVHVSSAASLGQMSGASKATGSSSDDNEDLAQEDKPRSRIMAEYLAHGYVMSDQVVQRAIAADQQHGISNRFMTALNQFDQKTKASERAQAVDKQYGISARADAGWRGLTSYFEKAAGTPTGQKLRVFYEQGQKQVLDVHNEAKHLAALKTGNNPQSTSGTKPTAEEAEMEKVDVDGKERTKCNCGGADGKCPCEPGKCACSGCSKAS